MIDGAIAIWVAGGTDADCHAEWPQWAEGSFRNLRGRSQERIRELKKALTRWSLNTWRVSVWLRIDASWSRHVMFQWLIREHLNTCYATNPETGERGCGAVGGCPQAEVLRQRG